MLVFFFEGFMHVDPLFFREEGGVNGVEAQFEEFRDGEFQFLAELQILIVHVGVEH